VQCEWTWERDFSSHDLTYYSVNWREELSKGNSSSSSQSRNLQPWLAKYHTSGFRLVGHRSSLEGLSRWLQIQLPALSKGYKTFMQQLRQHCLETGRFCCLNVRCCLPSNVELRSITRMGIGSHLTIRVIKEDYETRRRGKERRIYRVLVGKPEDRRPLGRRKLKWEGNIKTDLQEVKCGGYGIDRAGSGQGQVAGAFECGNEPSGSMKCGEILD